MAVNIMCIMHESGRQVFGRELMFIPKVLGKTGGAGGYLRLGFLMS